MEAPVDFGSAALQPFPVGSGVLWLRDSRAGRGMVERTQQQIGGRQPQAHQNVCFLGSRIQGPQFRKPTPFEPFRRARRAVPGNWRESTPLQTLPSVRTHAESGRLPTDCLNASTKARWLHRKPIVPCQRLALEPLLATRTDCQLLDQFISNGLAGRECDAGLR